MSKLDEQWLLKEPTGKFQDTISLEEDEVL